MAYGSANFFGQRKRRREEKALLHTSLPLRLTGGAGRGRGRGRGRGGGGGGGPPGGGPPGGGGGAGGVAPHLIPLHAQWNLAAHPFAMHWDQGYLQGLPVDSVDNPRISMWNVVEGGQALPGRWPWQAHGADAESFPGMVPMTGVRQSEEYFLEQRGVQIDIQDNIDEGGQGYVAPPYHQPKWSYAGIAPLSSYGPAWSAFYYIFSNLYYGGFTTLSDICSALIQICEDIISIGAGVIAGDLRAAFFFEGITDVNSAERKRLMITDFAVTLNAIIADPTLILDRMMRYLESEATFLFHRVYVNILVPGGGSLKDMPPKLRALRESYGKVRGYRLIEETDEGACALHAITDALSGAAQNIIKDCRKYSKAIPQLCKRFENYRKTIDKVCRGSKSKLLLAETKAELASYIGWVKGAPITPDEICYAVARYAQTNLLDLGVAIFDAIRPLQEPIVSYDPEKKIPMHILCIVYWNYSSITGDVPGGHYDCINTSNVTTWIQKINNTKRKDVRYSFKCFKLLTSAQCDDKGMICEYCKHWQLDIPNNVWQKTHSGSQAYNSILCIDCGVRFKSKKCYEQHRVPSTGQAYTACASARLCNECKRVHTIAYDCTRFYCKICEEFFPKVEEKDHKCFLKYVSEKKLGRVRNVIYADTEGSRLTGWHECICIAAVYDTICTEHLHLLKKQSPKCQSCWYHSDNWGWFCNECLKENELEYTNDCADCNKEHVRYWEGKESLSEFIEWVMTEMPGSTVVFHNGGRYDLQMVVMEMLVSGKYILSSDAMRGSQIIFFTAAKAHEEGKRKRRTEVRFIDSINYIQAPLRNFPTMFNFPETEKGVFPYEHVSTDPRWREYSGHVPSLAAFGVTDLEAANVDRLPKVRRAAVKHIMQYREEEEALYASTGQEWNALEKLEQYTINDVKVLKKGCDIFRRTFWELVGMDPFQCVSLASAIAASYRQPEFMLPKSIQIFSQEDREFQRLALRGGRCEPKHLYYACKPGESIYWVDVNSEYPFVQAYGYYPKGALTLDLKYKKMEVYAKVNKEFKERAGISLTTVLMDASGRKGCGIIECEIQSANSCIPLLPAKIKTTKYLKNVFQNRTGYWVGYLSVLALAIEYKQVIVRGVQRVQFWKDTTDKLFNNFICRLYAAKVEASGWSKILNMPEDQITEAQKQAYVAESKRRGIMINPENVKDNPGLRTTAKIMCNCGWGYLCQKPHGNKNHFFDNYDEDEVQKMGDFIEKIGKGELKETVVGAPVAVGKYTRIKTNKAPEDMTVDDMNKKIAYQVGGEVPAKGLQVLSRGLMHLHASQILYCDTDSIGYVFDEKNPEHKHIETGVHLGDWVNEYPNDRITQFISLGCKTYYLEIEDKKTGQKSYKGRFKGIPLGSSIFTPLDEKDNIAKFGFQEMKDMLFAAMRSKAQQMEDSGVVDEELHYTIKFENMFKRNPDYKITTKKEQKTIKFTFDKREVVVPKEFFGGDLADVHKIDTLPLMDSGVPLTTEEVERYWAMPHIQ